MKSRVSESLTKWLTETKSHLPGSFAAYGYMKDPEDKNALVTDEEAAEIFCLVFGGHEQKCDCPHAQ